MSLGNNIDYANLHTQSEESLRRLGCQEAENGIFLFPKSFFNDIPEGMVVTLVDGEKRRFHRGFDTDTRNGCLGYGVNILDPEHNKSDHDEAKTFDEYFAGLKNYGVGGNFEKKMIADAKIMAGAKKVFEALKTPEAIIAFSEAGCKEQQMVSGLDRERFGWACHCALKYAVHLKRVPKEKELAAKYDEYLASRLATARKRLADKIDNKLGTNLSDIKLPKTIKNIEAKFSKYSYNSGR